MKQEDHKSSLLDALLNPKDNATSDTCKFTRTKMKMSSDEQEAIDKAIELIREDNGLAKVKRTVRHGLLKSCVNMDTA